MTLGYDHLRRIALRRAHQLVAYDDVEDVAHDALLKVWRGRDRYVQDSDLAKVTATAVGNAAIDHRRAGATMRRTVPPPAPGSAVAPDAATEAIASVFVEWCYGQCRDARDRAALDAWIANTSPAQLLAERPSLFASVREIYNTNRNLAARLRRAYGASDD
jgi:DNA-directed RNA polymerase specialized sigma24 family protein